MKKFAFGLLPLAICVFAANSALAGNIVDNTTASGAVFEATPGCVYHYAQGNPNVSGVCDPATYVPFAGTDNNIVIGDLSTIHFDPMTGPGGENVIIGWNAHGGVAVDGNGIAWNPRSSVAIGDQSQTYGRYNTTLGAAAKTNGYGNLALGMAAVAGYRSYYDPVFSTGSIAIGQDSISYGNHSVALGSGSVADEDYTVSLGSSTVKRRMLNMADGVGDYDAVNVRQMRAVTDAMATQISGLDFRVTALENAVPGGGGGPVDLTPAYQYTDNSSAQTLNSANAYTDASSAQTLNSANAYTDISSAQTLSSANAYTDNSSAQTLSQANSYTDASSAQTLSSANAYTDISSAQTLSSANSYTDAAVAGVARESRTYTDHEIAKSEEFLSAGIAAVAAQPNLPALAAGQKAVAVGTGHFNGADAVGVAFGFAPRDGVVLSGGVSGVSGEGKPVFRTSASYVW